MISNLMVDTATDTQPDSAPPSVASSYILLKVNLDKLSGQPLSKAVPRLVRALSEIQRAELSAKRRIALLRRAKRLVLKVVASMPVAARDVTSGSTETLHQHLMTAMISNLHQALQTIDRMSFAELSDHQNERTWIVRNLFRFFERQIGFSIDHRRPWPQDTWKNLHQVFEYLVARGSTTADSGWSVDAIDEEHDLEHSYKRLLLLGFAAEAGHRDLHGPETGELMALWARRTRLQPPESFVAKRNVIRVQMDMDEPPSRHEAELTESFHGWAMVPPKGFTRYLAQPDADAELAKVLKMPQHSENQSFFPVDETLDEPSIEWDWPVAAAS